LRALSVIVASRSRTAAESFAACLTKHAEYEVRVKVIANGHDDPLYGVMELPDLLLLHNGPGTGELANLAKNGKRDQLQLIVCGPVGDPEAMRLAMQAGARDYLPDNVSEAELVSSVARFQEELQRSRSSDSGKMIVVVNGKGGSGASFLATNLAHSLVVDGGSRTTLFDLDMQFGGLYRYLDITPKVGLLQALEVADELDEVSAAAYTCEHSSGLRLLAAPLKLLTLASDVPLDRLEAVIDFYLSINDYVVADSPARLDQVTELFYERADRIVLVTQQSLPHLQDSARQLQLLTNELGISRKRIDVVVNRWSKNAEIQLDDIQKALRVNKLITVPNNYKIAHESINAGIPVAELAKTAGLTKGIRRLRAAIAEPTRKPEPGFLKRVMPNFLGG
jgi:pilus assembly protein CpaE